MVTQANSTRPTREQILFGLRVCLRETCYSEDPFEADTFFVLRYELDRAKLFEKHQAQIAAYKYCNDYDFHWDFIEPVKAYFGLIESEVPWEEIFESPDVLALTYGDVADFIAQQLALAVSFEPVVILSKPCQPAGVFLGLEELAGQVQPKVSKFGPSTPVQNILHGKGLLKFCEHLHWATIGQIPAPTEIFRKGSWPRRVIQLSLSFLVVWLMLGLYSAMLISRADAWMSVDAWFAVYFPVQFVTILFYIVSYTVMRWRWSPLPRGVSTFRDLAMLISDRMQVQADQVPPNAQVT